MVDSLKRACVLFKWIESTTIDDYIYTHTRKRGIATKNINAKNTRYTTTINKIMTNNKTMGSKAKRGNRWKNVFSTWTS